MWILTKFALIFFIMSLFAIIFMFEQNERANLCTQQVQKVADGIANRLEQIIDSPVEDEQRSFVFEGGIPLGSRDVTRYYVNISKSEVQGEPDTGRILIDAVPTGVKGCFGRATVPYIKKKLTLDSPYRFITRTVSKYKEDIITLSPSDLDENKRTFFLIAIKCGSKTYPPEKFLFIQDCTHRDPNDCWSFEADAVNQSCGFLEG